MPIQVLCPEQSAILPVLSRMMIFGPCSVIGYWTVGFIHRMAPLVTFVGSVYISRCLPEPVLRLLSCTLK